MYPPPSQISLTDYYLADLAQDLRRLDPKSYRDPPSPSSAGQALDRAQRVAELASRAEQGRGLWHAGDRGHDRLDAHGLPMDCTPPAARERTEDLVRRYVRRFGLLPVVELARVLRLKPGAVHGALARLKRKGQLNKA